MKNKYFASYIAKKKGEEKSFYGNATMFLEKMCGNEDLLNAQKEIIESSDIPIEEVCILYWKRYE